MIKEIKKHNGENFIIDLKRVRDVMVYADGTSDFFKVTKLEARKSAATKKIAYYITDKVFLVKRLTMVIV